MPFNSDFDDIYKLGIKNACTELEMYCERVDEQYYEGSMLERIYNQIHHADYIIADLSTKNPNVFYEVGYAHALNKKVILITQNGEDIPFDMKHYLHIIYDSNKISSLKEKLQDRLKWYVNDDSDENSGADTNELPMDLFINDTPLEKDNRVEIAVGLSYDIRFGAAYYTARVVFTLSNQTKDLFMNRYDYDFVYPNDLPLARNNTYSKNKGKQVLSLKFDNRLHPGQLAEHSEVIDIREYEAADKVINRTYECEVIVLMPDNPVTFRFAIVFK